MIGAGMKKFGMRMWVCLFVAFAIDGAALAQTPSPNEKKTVSITWLGHAVFEIVSHGAVADGQYVHMAWLAVKSLLQAATGYSNALRRIARVVERGRHSRRGRRQMRE
jgi:hypothetical protein